MPLYTHLLHGLSKEWSIIRGTQPLQTFHTTAVQLHLSVIQSLSTHQIRPGIENSLPKSWGLTEHYSTVGNLIHADSVTTIDNEPHCLCWARAVMRYLFGGPPNTLEGLGAPKLEKCFGGPCIAMRYLLGGPPNTLHGLGAPKTWEMSWWPPALLHRHNFTPIPL